MKTACFPTYRGVDAGVFKSLEIILRRGLLALIIVWSKKSSDGFR